MPFYGGGASAGALGRRTWTGNAAPSVAAAPTLSSVANVIGTSVGDVNGAYSVTLTGTLFTGATGVKFGGTSATAVTVVNATTITCTVPGHAAGVVDVIVTTPGGSNAAGNNAWEYYSPAQSATCTAWYRPNFGGSPWAAVASAGSSGSNGNLTEATNPPTAGAAQNGLTPASFNGSTSRLSNANPITTFVSNASGSIVSLFKIASAGASGGAAGRFNEPAFWGDSNGNFSFSHSVDGLSISSYDGTTWNSVTQPASTGSYHLGQGRYDATKEVRVDGGSWSTIAHATAALGASTCMVGTRFNGAAPFLNGLVEEIVIFSDKISNATSDKLRGYFATKYNLSTI